MDFFHFFLTLLNGGRYPSQLNQLIFRVQYKKFISGFENDRLDNATTQHRRILNIQFASRSRQVGEKLKTFPAYQTVPLLPRED